MRYTVHSPNRRITAEVRIIEGLPCYRILRDGQAVIQSSRLHVRLQGEPVPARWTPAGEEKSSRDELWRPVWGRSSEVRNVYQELRIVLKEENGRDRLMNLVFRIYDDGAAFRYEWPEQPLPGRRLELIEDSRFRFAGDPACWWSVEGEMEQKMNDGPVPLSRFDGGHSPMTIRVAGDCYVSLHEADVQRYTLSDLSHSQEPGELSMTACSEAELPHRSPWRAILLVDRPAELVQSHLIENLNPPSAIDDPSWIRPGKSMWDWRNHGAEASGFVYGLNTESMRRYIDFAAANGFEYAMVDAGWYGHEYDKQSDPTASVEAVDVPGLARYALEQGVALWVYVNDIALAEYDLDNTLSVYRQWGVAGIKHGFLRSQGQERVDFTRKVVEACARHRLMYVPHEPARPWGLHRTYPNYMASEFINGQYDGPGRPEGSPTYLCIVPFTNNVAGPLDRSSGMFDLDGAIRRTRVPKEAVTTIASQLAQCLVIYTGFVSLPDHPDSYAAKSDLFEFLRRLPVNWDETRALHDEIGEYVTIARRSGKEWFVASLANERGRQLEIPLRMLGDGAYTATVYEDGPGAHYRTNREEYHIRYLPDVGPEDAIEVRLAPGGGCAIWIRPKGDGL